MTDAEIILKMIEEVDPADTAKLDEIDALVACFIGIDVKRFDDAEGVNSPEYMIMDGEDIDGPCAKYTRSRDALKAIRPDGWQIKGYEGNCTGQFSDGFYCTLAKKDGILTKKFMGSQLPTEELAELHAIIQALNYERRSS